MITLPINSLGYLFFFQQKDRVELELEDLRQEYSQIRTGASEDIRSHEQRYRELREAFEQTEEQNQQQNNLIEQVGWLMYKKYNHKTSSSFKKNARSTC